MILHSPLKPPDPMRVRVGSKPVWSRPFWLLEWSFEWLSYGLSRWAFLEVLEYLGSFGVLVAVIFYFSESGDRLKQKHYQAWQVINTAQGKGGNGGRVEALEELNSDGISLIGVDVAGAFLQGIRLQKARLARANFASVDARNSDFRGTDFSNANLESGNFRDSDLSETDLSGGQLKDADLSGTRMAAADLSGATLDDADLHNADLQGIRWRQIRSIRKANLFGVKNAPDGFLAWAQQGGAVEKTAHDLD
jgi:pentapeptide repeat protein